MPFKYSNLIFEDNFAGLDKTVWSLRDEQQTSDDPVYGSWDAVKVNQGSLKVKAIPVGNGQFKNGHIGTEKSFQFTYGYAEARIKVHPYQGAHCSFWLQSSPWPYRPGDPEIDVFEYFGAAHPEKVNPRPVHHNVYYRNVDNEPLLNWHEETDDTITTRWSNHFYRYGIKWGPDGYTFYIDREPVAYTTAGASSTPKYLILSMISRDYETPKFRYDKADTYKMVVDYVRVWQ